MISDEELATFEHEYRGRNQFGTHWDGCCEAHADCLVLRLVAEVRRLRDAIGRIERATANPQRQNKAALQTTCYAVNAVAHDALAGEEA